MKRFLDTPESNRLITFEELVKIICHGARETYLAEFV
jgi:hypothetical protein